MADLRTELDRVLTRFGKKAVGTMISNLRKSGVKGTNGQGSRLERSLVFQVKKGKNIGISIFANDYWEYVEDGRGSGKMPPISNILRYVKTRNLDVSKIKGKNYEAKAKSLAFVIARAIGKKGTIKRLGYKGTKFVEKSITDELLNDMVEGIEVALLNDIENRFK